MFPHLQVAHVLLRAGGQSDAVIGETEGFHQLEGQFQHAANFVLNLLRAAEDMGVVLGEAAHPHQAMQHAAALVAVNRAQLGETQGQFAVAAQGRAVDGDVERAVHWLQVVFLLVHLHRRKHTLAVEIQVTAGLPQGGEADVGRVDHVVTTAIMDVLPVVLDEGAHPAALGVPYDQAWPDFVVDGVEAQLPPQGAVVAALRFLQPGQVGVQLILGLEGGAVDALEHRVFLVAPPVGPSNAE